jgi:hypothetical protein
MTDNTKVSIYSDIEVQQLRTLAKSAKWGWITSAVLLVSCTWLLGGYMARQNLATLMEASLTRQEALQGKLEVLVSHYIEAREQQNEVTQLMVQIGELQAQKEEMARYNKTHKSIPVAEAWKTPKGQP